MIFAIVVSFNPLPGELEGLISSLVAQVDHVLVVDNGSCFDVGTILTGFPSENISLLKLKDNFGVATALNRGVIYAEKMGATHVAFFDQDSLPAPNMIPCLFKELKQLERSGYLVAAVGPNYFDPRTKNHRPFIKIDKFRVVRLKRAEGTSLVEVDYLISSGCLVSLKALFEIGLMEEKLFIDFVDIEWGLRAREKGFKCFGVYDVKMKHKLGCEPLSVFGLKFPMHSPLRHYYHFRNAIWLLFQSWVPLQWKVVNFYRSCGKCLVFLIFGNHRLAHAKMIFQGVWHGLVGKMGRLD